jgi:hypothetical protein
METRFTSARNVSRCVAITLRSVNAPMDKPARIANSNGTTADLIGASTVLFVSFDAIIRKAIAAPPDFQKHCKLDHVRSA